MLKRICDRCRAEIPVEQTMSDDELILRRLNEKPYDLCPVCQAVLQSWFMPMLQMVGAARGAGKRYAGFNEEDDDDKRNDHAE